MIFRPNQLIGYYMIKTLIVIWFNNETWEKHLLITNKDTTHCHWRYSVHFNVKRPPIHSIFCNHSIITLISQNLLARKYWKNWEFSCCESIRIENFDPFLVKFPILYPLLYTWFSGVFRGYKVGTLTRNGLIMKDRVILLK